MAKETKDTPATSTKDALDSYTLGLEIGSMKVIADALGQLDADARRRVLAWAIEWSKEKKNA